MATGGDLIAVTEGQIAPDDEDKTESMKS